MIWHNKNCTPTFEQDEVSLIVWRDCGGKRLIECIPYCPLRDGDWEKFVYDFRIIYWSYEKDLLDQAQASERQIREKGFTPGPWFRKGQRVYWKKPDKDLPRGTLPNGLICTCKSAEDWPECNEEARANADLIAAAPDLLHALEHATHSLCVTHCASCLPQGSETGMAIFFREGCPRGCSSFDCDMAKWWEIIRKVVEII